MKTTRLETGRVVTTATAASIVPAHEMIAALQRHIGGDWGDVCEEDRAANDWALEAGERILSAYRTAAGTRFWIITERDQSVTTILLPSDY